MRHEMTVRRLVCVAVVVCLSTAAQAADWGDLSGQFVLDGKLPAAEKLVVTKDIEVCGKHDLVDETVVIGDDGGVANIVIYVRGFVDKAGKTKTKGVKVHPDLEATPDSVPTLDNKNCRFEPRIVGLRTDQPLHITNSDPVSHNTNIQPLGQAGTNPLLPAGGTFDFQFTREQRVPVKVTCNVHPWMSSYVLPRATPYFAVSDKDGKFTIENLPAVELEFVVWHEVQGYLKAYKKGRMTKKIKSGSNDLGTIKVKADWLK